MTSDCESPFWPTVTFDGTDGPMLNLAPACAPCGAITSAPSTSTDVARNRLVQPSRMLDIGGSVRFSAVHTSVEHITERDSEPTVSWRSNY
jgi:hypothetical protein